MTLPELVNQKNEKTGVGKTDIKGMCVATKIKRKIQCTVTKFYENINPAATKSATERLKTESQSQCQETVRKPKL